MKKLDKPCRLCNGLSKSRCIMCGWKKNKAKKKAKKDMSPDELFHFECEQQRIEYLQETRKKLKRFNMGTTGVRSVDDQIIKEFGDWLNRRERANENYRQALTSRLIEYMEGTGDVYVDELHDIAAKWVMPEAFPVHPDDYRMVVDLTVKAFIIDYTVEEVLVEQ